MFIAMLLAVLTATETEPPAFFAASDELRGYLLEAGENSPMLHARYAEWQAAMERIPQATSLDDPMFGFTQFLKSEDARFRIMLSQELPWFGTLRARGEQACAEADALLNQLYEARNRLFAELKTAYFDYALLAKEIEITTSQTEVLSYMQDVVRSKLALGLVNQDDLLRVSIEEGKIDDRRAGYEQIRPAFQARLNTLMGRASGTEVPWPGETVFPPAVPAQDEVLTRVRAANPDLKRLDAMIESREKGVELAKLAGYPRVAFGVEFESMQNRQRMESKEAYMKTLEAGNDLRMAFNDYVANGTPLDPVMTGMNAYTLANTDETFGSMNMEDTVALSVSMNVPIWRKRIRAGVREAKRMEQAVIEDKRGRELDLEGSVQMALYSVQDAQRRYMLYKDRLLPQASLAYQSILSEYASEYGMSSFLDVLGSVQTLLDFQLEQLRAGRDWQVAAAQLEYLMGGPWEGAPIPEIVDADAVPASAAGSEAE